MIVLLAKRLFHLQLGADGGLQHRDQKREDSALRIIGGFHQAIRKKEAHHSVIKKVQVLKVQVLLDGWFSDFLFSIQFIVYKSSLFLINAFVTVPFTFSTFTILLYFCILYKLFSQYKRS